MPIRAEFEINVAGGNPVILTVIPQTRTSVSLATSYAFLMTPLPDKDATIISLLARLRTELGECAFDIVDHWEADLCAIGLGMPSDHTTLIYVSTYGHPDGEYDYELEEATKEDGAVYSVAGLSAAASYEELKAIIKKHLQVIS